MRKFIFAVMLILVTSIQNIAGAANFNNIDWKNAPRFNSKAEFFKYIKECEKNCKTEIAVIFTNGLLVNVDEFLKVSTNSQYVNITWLNEKPVKALYETGIYPGAKVEYAYRTGNTSILSADEKKLYNVAVQIVNEAKKQPTPLQKELFLHEKITQKVSYYTAQTNSKAPRHCTAIGALIDGRANCQGYVDAFYMLGRMAGLNVGKMTGVANNTPHAWNSITFGDGRIYAVDVTFDDASFVLSDGEYNNYIYFNAPLEILKTTHTWEAAYNPTLQPKIDGRYFYCTKEFFETDGKYFAFNARSAEEALNYIAQRISKNGYRFSWGMAPYNSNYANTKFSLNRLVREILPNQYNFYGQAKMSIARRGNWIFYTVDAQSNN